MTTPIKEQIKFNMDRVGMKSKGTIFMRINNIRILMSGFIIRVKDNAKIGPRKLIIGCYYFYS